MRHDWRQVFGFPSYQVNSLGAFTNARTGREVSTSLTPNNHVKINLYRDGQIHTRSAALLVAKTFLEEPKENWDTPIHLDGDKTNCAADNLMWRPRWFAIRYHRQFEYESFHSDKRKFQDVKSGDVYYGMKEVCMANGLYWYDVEKSATENTFVPLTYQYFRWVP